jgi:hypothetical protein
VLKSARLLMLAVVVVAWVRDSRSAGVTPRGSPATFSLADRQGFQDGFSITLLACRNDNSSWDSRWTAVWK